jgi:mannose-6-phosphate isomerase-like protein (cupin superfamily)
MPVKVNSIKRKANDTKAQEMVTYFGVDSTNSETKSIAVKFDVIPPHTKTDEHPVAHPVESVIFIIKGKLRFHVQRADGTLESFEIKTNDFVYVPPNEPHYGENVDDEAVESIVTIPSRRFVN